MIGIWCIDVNFEPKQENTSMRREMWFGQNGNGNMVEMNELDGDLNEHRAHECKLD